jgi:hypothetical protein
MAESQQPSTTGSPSGPSATTGLRLRAARHRVALGQSAADSVDLSEIAKEVRRIRRS